MRCGFQSASVCPKCLAQNLSFVGVITNKNTKLIAEVFREPTDKVASDNDGIWLVSFMDYDLGYIDLEEKTLQPLPNPFGPKVLPMS